LIHQPDTRFAARPHRHNYGEAIQWEELPSLAPSLVMRAASTPAAAKPKVQVWTETLPASLDPLQPSAPFAEAVEGLMTREVREPDVFRHFFGDAAIVARGTRPA
jgi:hypothetical protein